MSPPLRYRTITPLSAVQGAFKRYNVCGSAANSFFSDEKNFVVDPCYNPQNDRFICVGDPAHGVNDAGNLDKSAPHPQYVACTKKPASLMFFASTGEFCLPIWFPEGFRQPADDYVAVLPCKVVPWMREVAAKHGKTFVFQQDSSPAHISKKTTAFLQEENVPFWPRTFWPPNSPDLAPLDFGVWPMVVQRACKVRAPSVKVLKRRVNAAWKSLEAEKIRGICAKFRPRLEECVKNEGKNLL